MHPNEKILRAALDARARGDTDTFARMVNDDVTIHFPGVSQLSGEFRGNGAFPARVMQVTGGTFQLAVHDVLASDDHAVGIYVMRAQRDGKSIEWRQVNVYHIRDGKIVEAWHNPLEQNAVDEFFS